MQLLTIKDIARESGYAVSTVSRALNDHPDVSREAKEKIKAIVAAHKFVPNSNARQLKVQQNRSIIIVVKGAFNMFFAAILERMQSLISCSGYSAEVHYLDEDADEVLVGEQLQRERKPLGFIFLGGNTCSFEARFSAIAVPSVLATTLADHLNFGNLSSVGIDDTAAGRRAARFLLSRGHRRIAVIGGNRAVSSISDQRYQGFLQGLADEGLSHDEALYQKANYNLGSGYRAMNKLLARDAGFTAVFCMSDIMAVGAMRALTDAGLRVPQDTSVRGFDGIELGQYAVPRLATVSQPQQEIADQSVALLLGQIEKAAPPQTRVVSTGLLEGESVASVTSDI